MFDEAKDELNIHYKNHMIINNINQEVKRKNSYLVKPYLQVENLRGF